MTELVRLSQGDRGSFVSYAVVESCMERAGPTGVVDVPVELFPGTAAVLSGTECTDVEVVV